MRIHLVWPKAAIPFLGQIKPEDYLGFLTIHGTLMVFFVLSTVPQNGFGTYFLPLQLGSSEMAFPGLNRISFWTTLVSLLVLLSAFFVPGGASIAGWTQYAPLSAIGTTGPGQNLGTDLWLASIGLFCVGSVLSAINFVTTTARDAGSGHDLVPNAAYLLGMVYHGDLEFAGVQHPAGGLILLFLDRHAGTNFFVPAGLIVSGQAITQHSGGSPLLWQHLFWFFGHPEVYIAILPGMGLTSHLLSVFSRKPVFGYKAMVTATIAIGAMGFMVWGHHMFVSGMDPHVGFAFSTLTTAIAVPSAIKVFNWLGTIYGGKIRFTTPMLFSIGFVSLFITGGLTGPLLAQPALDVYLHDTYFVVAHFHLIMAMAGLFAIFAATHFWFPKMFGRLLNERLGAIHFWITFIGAYAIFMPMHLLGLAGHPRRYSELTGVQYVAAMLPLQRFITYAAMVTIADRWCSCSTSSGACSKARRQPAIHGTPRLWSGLWLRPPALKALAATHRVVHTGPYEYSVPGADEDFVMQERSTGRKSIQPRKLRLLI